MALRFFALAALAVLVDRRRLLRRGSRATQRPARHVASRRCPALCGRHPQRPAACERGSPQAGLVLADLSRHLDSRAPRPSARRPALLESRRRDSSQRTPKATPLVAIDAVTRGDPQSLKAALEGLGLEHACGVCATTSAAGSPSPRSRPQPLAPSSSPFAQRCRIRAARWPCRATTCSTARWCAPIYSDDHRHRGHGRRAVRQLQLLRGLCRARERRAGERQPGLRAQRLHRRLRDGSCRRARCRARTCSRTVLRTAGRIASITAPRRRRPFTDEGRAMLQIVHAVAPGAALAFYTADDSEADFATGIRRSPPPARRSSPTTWAISTSRSFRTAWSPRRSIRSRPSGVAYFSAAGNDSNLSYQNTAPSFATAGSGSMAGEYLLNFDTTGATNTTSLPVTVPPIPPGDFLAIVVEWDQPYVTGATGASPGATSSIDLCVTGATGSAAITDSMAIAVSCTGRECRRRRSRADT